MKNSALIYALSSALSLAIAAPAFGQAYVHPVQPQAFRPIATIPGIGSVTTQSFVGSLDDNSVAITLPFTFNFVGTNFTQINASTNGYITFGSESATSYSNVSIGTRGNPDQMIAPWWDDLEANSAASVRSGTYGSAPNRVFVVEVGPVHRLGNSGSDITWQVYLYETSGRFDFQVDGALASGSGSGTVGYEGPLGTPSFATLSCSTSGNCTTADQTSMVGNLYINTIAEAPELTGAFGTGWVRGAFPGQQARGPISIRNFGQNAAPSVVSDIYLSLDNVLDASDIRVGTATVPGVVGGGASTTRTATINLPANTAPGDYFLILNVDAPNAYPEASESDNVVASSFRFATAYDVAPAAARSQNGGNPGDPIAFDLTLSNNGVPYSGQVGITVYASLDQIFDAQDVRILDTTATMNGNLSQNLTLNGTVPALAPGRYYPVVVLDAANQIVELNESNNVFTSASSFPSGPDFTVSSVTMPPQAAPGTQFQVTTVVASTAVPYTGAVTYRLYLSADQRFDASDTLVGTFTENFAGQASISSQQTMMMPTNLMGSIFYGIAVVDPANGIRELDEMNNTAVSATQVLTGYDFRVANVSVSANGQAGSPITITAQLQSVGLPYTGQVPYRVYFSPNDTFDLADTAVFDGTVFLAGLTQTAINVTFPLPADVPIATYYAIVYVDADRTIMETDTTNNWSTSLATIRLQGAELFCSALDGPEYGFFGHEYPVTITIENNGEVDADNFQWSLRISENDIIRVTDPEIYLSPMISIPARGSYTVTTTVVLPTYTATASRYLGALIDIFSAVGETRETNNTRAIPHPVRVLFPIPDLSGGIVETSTAGAAGEQLAITRILRNEGVAPANNFTYTYFLSSNPTISKDDIAIGSFTLSIAEGGDDYRIDLVNIPSSVPAGRYFVGIILDPEEQLEQITRANDAVVGPQLQVFAATIRFVTTSLPGATLGVDYEAGLFAAGGATALSWSVASGTLPAGLSLEASSGIISGTPTAEGLSNFVIRAASGTAYADKAFSLRVSAATIPLEVASETLPPGFAGRPYTANVVAVGGTIPYSFTSVTGSSFPQGLTLGEDGTISGTPRAPGNYRLLVQVRDALGASATRAIALNVVNPNQSLTILQQALKIGTVGLEYSDPDPVAINATGGVPPYRFSIVGTGVPGLTLAATGTISGIPDQAGDFPLLVRVDDASGLYDTSLFILQIDSGTELLLSTGELASGTVGTAYTAQLTAVRGATPYKFSIANGALPPGLTMTEAGAISGTPTTAGVFSFVAVVQDTKLRSDVRPLSIIIAAVPSEMMTTSSGGCGCSTAGPKDRLEGAAWAVGLFLVLGVRRARQKRAWLRSLLVGGALLALAAPAFAQTQVPGTPYLISRAPLAYVPITGGTTLFPSGFSNGNPTVVTLPFPFHYYDHNYTQVSISEYGAIAMGTASISSENPPPGSPPPFGIDTNGFIAPYWDFIFNHSGTVDWKVEGTAPQRVFVVQWSGLNFCCSDDPGLNFQVRLFEGISGRIQVRYGAPLIDSTTGFADGGTMGMEDPDGGRPVLFQAGASACTDGCSLDDYLGMTDTQVELVQDPGVELVGVDIAAPAFGYLGTPMSVDVTIANAHSRTLGPFTYAVYANRTRSLSGATLLYTSSGVTFPAFSVSTLQAPVVPSGLMQGEYYLLLDVDNGASIAEVDETNNVAVTAARTRILNGKADLVVDNVTLSTQVGTAGSSLTVYAKISNRGSDPATADMGVMLSSNPAVTPQDGELSRFNLTVAAGETVTTTQTVTLPANTNSGTYYVGIFADLANTVDELSESNNGLAAFSPISVSGAGLAITTTRLPNATTGAAYSGLLSATGGEGGYTWEIRSGRLPHNIGLVPATGELFGRAIEAGSQTFTVRVTSGGSSTERMLTLDVVTPNAPLTIVSRRLPTGIVGEEYSATLAATGGSRTATLAWSATGVPAGLSLSSAGLITGIPTTVGTATISVTLSDGASTATRDMLLDVRSNTALLMNPVALDNGTYQTPYSADLSASGGVPPYTWTIESGSLPAGVTVNTSGHLGGTPTSVGTFRFVVKVRDAANGGLSAVDFGTFELTIDGGGTFLITTSSLAAGHVGEGYDVTVDTSGGGAPFVWRISEGRLNPGLTSEINPQTGAFRIAGTPTEVGVSNILVQVVDSSGRVAVKPFTIEVTEKPVEMMTTPTKGGCSCSADGTSGNALFGLALLGLGLALRHRRR
ncbi:MAG: CARDB domain-containing protein [Myxococcota bacterium]